MVTAATDSSGVGVDSTQVSIANYLDSLTGPITSGCKYELYEDDDADNDGYQFNVFYVNCPILPNRAVYVTFTDSVKGWRKHFSGTCSSSHDQVLKVSPHGEMRCNIGPFNFQA